MGLTPAPVNAWYLAWVALIPLWILVRQQKSVKQVILLALAWGCGYHGLALFWITGVHPMTWMGVPWIASLAIAIFCWVFITLWGTGIVVAWSVIVSIIARKINGKNILVDSLIRVLIGVSIWCSLEVLCSFTPLWWTALAYTQSPHNLIVLQLGKVSGISAVTGIIVAVNGLLSEAILLWQKAYYKLTKLLLFLSLLVLITGHLIGYYLYQYPVSQDNLSPIKVGIIQGNIPNEIKLYSAGWRKAIAGYTNGYQRLAKQGVDVVLTPEGALPFYWEDILDNSSFYQAVLAAKVPVWLGAHGRDGNSFTNSLFTLTGEGKTFSRYDKYKLVPLGEYIPFESVLGKIIDRLSPLNAHQTAGEPDQVFDTPFGRAIVGICYESAFSQHFQRQARAGGEFIITASNNAHYSKTMPAQHHAQDVMRAIETDRWAARATNTGYSGIVDPRGRTIWISAIDEYAIHAGTIYRRDNQTLYVRWGDWLTPTLLILSFGSLTLHYFKFS